MLIRGRGSAAAQSLIGDMVLTWNTSANTPTPGFWIDFPLGNGAPTDIQVGDVLRFEAATDGGSVWTPYVDITVTAGHLSGDDPLSFEGATPLEDGDYDVRVHAMRSGFISGYALEDVHIDTTIPLLSAAGSENVTGTTADLKVTTNKDYGELYVVLTQSTTAPTATQIKAGDDEVGAGADFADSITVAAAGVQTIAASLLLGEVEYFAYFVHDNLSGVSSNVVTTSFTTEPAVFDPLSLAPFAMFDADPAVGGLFQTTAGATAVAIDNDPVGFWTDLSGTGFHLNAAANDTTRPLYEDASGIHVLKFNGTNSALKRLADPALYNSGAFTISLAMRANVLGNLAVARALVAEAGTPSTAGQAVRSSAGTLSTAGVFFRDLAGTSLVINDLGTGVWTNAYKVVTYTWDGATISAYVNGVPTGVTRSLVAGASYISDRFSLGAYWTSAGAYSVWFDAHVSHLFIKRSTLSAPNLAALITYQGAKVGLTI